MSEEIDPATLKATKASLGGYVKKPPLSDKLLSKPPFKFLHDVFSAVIREHGLMDGLFKPEEMNSGNFKDKESKVGYIQKVIDTLEFIHGEKLSIKPGKVVAGLEAGKTNTLLQSIGKALSNKADSSDAVSKVLAGEKFGKKDKSSKKSKDGSSPKKSKSITDATNKSPDKKSRDKDKKRSKKDDGDEKPKKSKKSKKDSKSEEEKEKKSSKEKKKPKPEPEPEPDVDGGAAEEVIPPPTRPASGRPQSGRPQSGRPQSGRPTSQRPASGRPTSQRPASGRPGSARPALSPSLAQPPPPLPEETDRADVSMEEMVTLGGAATLGEEPEPAAMLQMNGEPAEAEAADFNMDTTLPLNDTARGFSAARPRSARASRPSSARPAAPRPKPRAAIEQELVEAAPSAQTGPQVLFDEEDDDDDNFVVEEKHAPPDPGLAVVMQSGGGDNLAEQAEDGEHGLLVSQILETKKSMEEEIRSKSPSRPDPVDKSRFMDKEAVRKEVVRLRESIQKVTKSANPLGKMMDFLQEDVDSMQRELDRWRLQNKQITQQIRAEVEATNSSVEPMRAALAEYEHTIQDQLDRISAVRGATLINEQKVSKLMGGVMNVAAAAD